MDTKPGKPVLAVPLLHPIYGHLAWQLPHLPIRVPRLFTFASRTTLLTDNPDIHPPGSDDESSDGGEYLPNNGDDSDEEDAFMDTSDGFTDTDFDMEVDIEDDMWERSDEISAESEPSSEGDSMEDQDGMREKWYWNFRS
jgi:hypothetical protein